MRSYGLAYNRIGLCAQLDIVASHRNDEPLIELLPLAPPPAVAPGAVNAPPRRWRPNRKATILGAVVAVLFVASRFDRSSQVISKPPSSTSSSLTSSSPTSSTSLPVTTTADESNFTPTASTGPSVQPPIRPARSNVVLSSFITRSTGDLFVLSEDQLWRINLSNGSTVVTAIEQPYRYNRVLPTNEGAVLAGNNGVLLVRDGDGEEVEVHRHWSGLGPFPGPPETTWLWRGEVATAPATLTSTRPTVHFRLGSLDGLTTIALLPAFELYPWSGDDRGNLLVSGNGGNYLVTQRGIRRVTRGMLVAAGVNHWLVTDCDDVHVCTTSQLNRDTGEERSVDANLVSMGEFFPGTISHDGRWVAVNSTFGTRVVDLSNGSSQHLTVASGQQQDTFRRPMVWTPDSSALYFIDDDSDLSVFDTATRVAVKTVVPGVRAVSIRGVAA